MIYQTNDLIPIEVFIVDSAGVPVTGLGAGAIGIRILRKSDGFLLDWADDTFQSSGWTTITQDTTEIDATNAPGLYEVVGAWDTSAVTNLVADDSYDIIPINVSAPATTQIPVPGELRVGHHMDFLDAAISAIPAAPTASVIADAVWDEVLAGHVTVGSAARILDEIHKIMGLASGTPMVVTPTTRAAGAGVTQTIGKVGDTVTVTRT